MSIEDTTDPTESPSCEKGVLMDEFYKLPIYESPSVSEFNPTSEIAIHRVGWSGGIITLVATVRDSRQLTITYQGAIERDKHSIPFFHRLVSRKRSDESFIVFADPTLELHPELGLGWYIGAEKADPGPTFIEIVRKMQDISNAEAVAFCGASGGGFAALQHSSEYPGSIAVAFNPQTDVYQYYRGHRERLLAAAFPGHTVESARDAYERRLSVLPRYREPMVNRVRYVMNQGDTHHIDKHLGPFASIFGLETTGGRTEDGLVEIIPIDLGEGHVSPPQDVFESEVAAAYESLGFPKLS
ncbi:hypothetical protein [Glutamicibacter nicotianae]|uniref:hypothetical protein n=1 Tax=Glutamicibacter nicotianae TaxID=37929 RepID=UPI0013CEBDE5|nr:hypothetical protein [Glutamicibacter nicotianae]